MQAYEQMHTPMQQNTAPDPLTGSPYSFDKGIKTM